MDESDRLSYPEEVLMKPRHATSAYSGVGRKTVLLITLFWSLTVCNAYSEVYFGGQVGSSVMGNSLTDISLTDFSPNGTMSDRELSRSLLFGAKIGYYFPQARWFGVETEVFYTTPHIKQQNTRVTVPPGSILQGFGAVSGGTAEGVLSGDYLRLITWAPVNLMFRYPAMRLQPYVGVGLGLFFARVHTTQVGVEGSQSDMSIGLNAKAGLEFYITRNLSAFGEWKYNRASFGFGANSSGTFGFDADYQVHFATIGLNLHF